VHLFLNPIPFSESVNTLIGENPAQVCF